MKEQTNEVRYAKERKAQTDLRREDILQSAKSLFLKDGLENVTMTDIAQNAGISKMTLYRYFSSIDPIAVEIAGRVIGEIYDSIKTHGTDEEANLATAKQSLKSLVMDFDKHRESYKYLGMFDHLYSDNYPTEELAENYKKNIYDIRLKKQIEKLNDKKEVAMFITVGNMTFAFLEKMASRGELLHKEQGISVEDQLKAFLDILDLVCR